MRLAPLSSFSRPAYPTRATGLGHSLRRGLAAAGAAALLAGVSCGPRPGPEPIRPPGQAPATIAPADEDGGAPKEAATRQPPARDLAWCQFTPRLSGDRQMNQFFECAPSPPASLAPRPLPRWVVDGRVCAGQTAWSRIRVDAPTRTTIAYEHPNVALAVIAPDGTRVAELDSGRPCVTVTLEPGVWLLAATLRPGPGPGAGTFELWFEPPGAP